MAKIDTFCPECETEVVVENFVKYSMRELQRQYVYYKFTCPACKARTQTEDGPVYGSTVVNPMLDRPKHRDPNSGALVMGRESWETAPSDLKQKLEEEARLRAEIAERESTEGE